MAQVTALRSSDRHDMRVILADSEAASGNLFLPEVDAAYCIPRCSDPALVPALQRIIENEKVRYIYSGLDEEMPVLARNREAIESSGCQLLLPEAEALENALDKGIARQILDSSIRHPMTWELCLSTDTDAIFRMSNGKVVLKTTNSRGGRHVYMPADREEYEFYCKRALKLKELEGMQFLVQAHVDGDEYNVSTLHDLNGRQIYAVSRRKFEKRAMKSTTMAAVIERNDAVISMAVDAVERLELACGFNNVEIIVSHADGLPYFIEVNGGRTAAQDMNLVASGINITDLAMAIMEGETVMPLEHPCDGIATLKIRRDVIVNFDDIAAVPKA